MKLNIFAHKNVKIGCFTNPIYSDVEVDKFVVNEKRSLLACEDLKLLVPYKNLVLYFIGIFDDETGEIITIDADGNKLLTKLFDVGALATERIASEKGVSVDEIESVPAAN